MTFQSSQLIGHTLKCRQGVYEDQTGRHHIAVKGSNSIPILMKTEIKPPCSSDFLSN